MRESFPDWFRLIWQDLLHYSYNLEVTQLSVKVWVFGRASPAQTPTSSLQLRKSYNL